MSPAPGENALEGDTQPAESKRVVLLAGPAQRLQLIGQHADAALVSDSLPLRANLSVMENIATVLQFRTNSYIGEAEDIASQLLKMLSRQACAQKRDPDLDHEERFIAKLLRALVVDPPLILIDRPAQLLPDSDYPVFLNRTLVALEGRFAKCWILDYVWNKPLYQRRA